MQLFEEQEKWDEHSFLAAGKTTTVELNENTHIRGHGGIRKLICFPKNVRYILRDTDSTGFEILLSFDLPVESDAETMLIQLFDDHSKKIFSSTEVLGPLPTP
eukprot:UN00149